MSQARTHDLKSNLLNDVSIEPETELSGTTAKNGDKFDTQQGSGPVHGHFLCGEATGGPTSYTATCKMQESADGSTSWGDIATQTTLVLSADKTSGFIRAIHTKRYVRCVATPAFVGGTTPKLPIGATVMIQDRTI